jgi:hypothetical protein
MWKKRAIACALSVASLTQSLGAQTIQPPGTGFDPSAHKAGMSLPTTKVLVLGTQHLDGAPEGFRTEWLEPVMCRLRAYHPDVILTELMPGTQIFALDAGAAYYGTAAEEYAGPVLTLAKQTQAALGLTGPQALVEANKLIDRGALAPSDRRRLAALFLAAAEPFSAVVQWLRLPAAEHVARDGLTSDMVAKLDRYKTRRSELVAIDARLAADLGHERVYGIGDHSSDVAQPDEAALKAATDADPALRAKLNWQTPALAPYNHEHQVLSSPGAVLPMYQALNDPHVGELDADAQSVSMNNSKSAGALGRQRVAAWEAQNLQMLTGLREVTAAYPGKRVLLVIGSSHKPMLDAYLRLLLDVDVVSAPAILSATAAGCGHA